MARTADVLDINELSKQIEHDLNQMHPIEQRRPRDYAALHIRTAPPSMPEFQQEEAQVSPSILPDYVEHRPDISEIGKLSAEAVVQEYEATAKALQAMGDELILTAKRCEEMTGKVRLAIEDVRITTEAYREEGKRIFEQIESCAKLTDDVVKTCADLRSKIAVNTP